MLQKLVTIFLHDQVGRGKKYGDPEANPFLGVCEHLEEYLDRGWRIKDVQTMGGAGGMMSGWVVVLMEK